MKTVEVEPLDYWGWECPDCEHWNETQDNPDYEETVFCDGCGKEFEPKHSDYL